MPRVIHFEFMAQDPVRASQFYSDIFGWSITKWDGPADYWLVTTGEDGTPGINGGIAQSKDTNMPGLTVNTVEVPSVDEYAAKVTDHGGTVVMPKMTIPGVGYLVYCKDTEGTIFGILQVDRNAQA